MKFSKEQMERFSASYTRTARANGYKITLFYNEHSKNYFFCTEKNGKNYNSYWDKRAYRDEQSCIAAIEQWIKNKK